MAKALKCDRCGQFYDPLSEPRRYLIEDGKYFRKFVDLCPGCYTTFTKWLTGEKPQSDLADIVLSAYGTGELYPGEFEEE